jgi:6-O-methylguanine DNA methyltransferase, DNA binding domain
LPLKKGIAQSDSGPPEHACPKTMRAVGNACSNNHLAIAEPCQRVPLNDGSLSAGYRWAKDCQGKNHGTRSGRRVETAPEVCRTEPMIVARTRIGGGSWEVKTDTTDPLSVADGACSRTSQPDNASEWRPLGR